jgi:hypothetical protein
MRKSARERLVKREEDDIEVGVDSSGRIIASQCLVD